MVSLEKAVIAKLVKGGEKFEVLVDPDKAMQVKGGKDVPTEDLLAAREVYEDAHKGMRVPGDKINKTFGTNDIGAIAVKIIREGEVQLTTEQRRKMLEDKTKVIANIISQRGVNPQNGMPHPADRVMRAMEQAKVRVAIEHSAEEQIDAILKALQPIIPIRFEKIKVAIKIPAEFAGRGSGVVRNFGTPSKEEWAGDGSYICIIEIPAGLQKEIYDKLNNLTHGSVEVKVIKENEKGG